MCAACLAAAALAADRPPVGNTATPRPGQPGGLSPDLPVVSVSPEPLTAAAFKPFGEVIAIPETQPPTSDLGVLRWWGGLAKAQIHEQIEFGMFTVKTRPREVAEMERHVKTPEFLVGLGGEFILVVGRPSVGPHGPDAAKVKAFEVKPGQAVLMSRGTWHAWPFPHGDEGLFLVAFRDATATRDLKTKPFRGREVVKF